MLDRPEESLGCRLPPAERVWDNPESIDCDGWRAHGRALAVGVDKDARRVRLSEDRPRGGKKPPRSDHGFRILERSRKSEEDVRVEDVPRRPGVRIPVKVSVLIGAGRSGHGEQPSWVVSLCP